MSLGGYDTPGAESDRAVFAESLDRQLYGVRRRRAASCPDCDHGTERVETMNNPALEHVACATCGQRWLRWRESR